jgi:hypothetical protein
MPVGSRPRKSHESHGLGIDLGTGTGNDTGHEPGNVCWSGRRIFLVRAACAAWLIAVAAVVPTQATSRADELQRVVDALRVRLGISAAVTVSVVDREERLVSVRREAGRSGESFSLAVQRDFVEGLGDGQVEAALAHELGHVWIYTHHPYLQTEELANRVAMRAVSRERLVEVYRGVWGAGAVHGDLAAFLGLEERAAQR